VLTTPGFRDVLEVGRGNHTIRYNIKATRPPPLLVRHSRAFEVGGRSYYDGTIARSADPATLVPSIEI
jgi:N-methylhydantoinase A/oxoprolinase/acetone carboxylase beta subunit